MIIFKDKTFATDNINIQMDENDNIIDENYLCTLPNNSELCNKIVALYPNFDFVYNNNGNLIDVVEILDSAKSRKISELSAICDALIHAGVDYNNYHYAMSDADQINLESFKTTIMAGTTSVPYHADNEICRVYSAQEFLGLYQACAGHKVYHLSYFNQLKDMIKKYTTLDEVYAVTYGMALDEEHTANLMSIIQSIGE